MTLPTFTHNNTPYCAIHADQVHNSLIDIQILLNNMNLTGWNQYQSMMYLNAIMLILQIISGNNIVALLNDMATFNNNHYFNQLLPLNKCKNVIIKYYVIQSF